MHKTCERSQASNAVSGHIVTFTGRVYDFGARGGRDAQRRWNGGSAQGVLRKCLVDLQCKKCTDRSPQVIGV